MKIENFISTIGENVTSTTPTAKKNVFNCEFSVQVFGSTTSGSGSLVVDIEVSNVPEPTVDGHWVRAGTITLTLSTTLVGDALAVIVPYKNVRTRATTITGTGAKYSSYLCAG